LDIALILASFFSLVVDLLPLPSAICPYSLGDTSLRAPRLNPAVLLPIVYGFPADAAGVYRYAGVMVKILTNAVRGICTFIMPLQH